MSRYFDIQSYKKLRFKYTSSINGSVMGEVPLET